MIGTKLMLGRNIQLPYRSAGNGFTKKIYLLSMCSIMLASIVVLQQKWYINVNLTSLYIFYFILGLSNLCLTPKGISWDKIVGWSFFAYTIGVPLYAITNGGLEEFIGSKMYYSEVYQIDLIKESLIYNGLFLSAFYMAYFSFPQKTKIIKPQSQKAAEPKKMVYNYYHSKLFIMYWILAAMGLMLFGMVKINYFSAIAAGYSLGNSGYIFVFTGVFAINAGILILLRFSDFDKRYLIFAACIHLILFPLGIRQLTLTFVIQLIFMYKFTNPAKKFKAKEIVFGILLVLLFGVIGSLRSGGGLVNITGILKAPLSFFFYETTFNYISFLKCLELFQAEHISFLYGKTLADPFIELIPSFLIGDKGKYQAFESFIATYKSIQNLRPVGTAHLLTELYVNGGIASISVFAVLIGILSGIINDQFQKMRQSGHRLGQIAFAVIIPFVIIQLNRGGISVLIKLSVQFALLPIFIVVLFRKEVMAGSVLLFKKMMNVRWIP